MCLRVFLEVKKGVKIREGSLLFFKTQYHKGFQRKKNAKNIQNHTKNNLNKLQSNLYKLQIGYKLSNFQ